MDRRNNRKINIRKHCKAFDWFLSCKLVQIVGLIFLSVSVLTGCSTTKPNYNFKGAFKQAYIEKYPEGCDKVQKNEFKKNFKKFYDERYEKYWNIIVENNMKTIWEFMLYEQSKRNFCCNRNSYFLWKIGSETTSNLMSNLYQEANRSLPSECITVSSIFDYDCSRRTNRECYIITRTIEYYDKPTFIYITSYELSKDKKHIIIYFDFCSNLQRESSTKKSN